MLVQPLIWMGVGRHYPWMLLGLEVQAKLAWGLVALALLAGGLRLARALTSTGTGRAFFLRFAGALLFATPVLTAAFDIASARHFAAFGYERPGPLLVLDAALLAVLVLWARSARSGGRGVALAALFAAAHRLSSTALFPLDSMRSNMLAMVLHGVRVWNAGGSPYAPGDALRMRYPPGTWLAHAPSVWLGVDPRILGSAVLLIIGLGLAWTLRGQSASGAEILAMLVLLNPYHAFRHDLYFDAFLALSTMIFYLAAREAGPLPENSRFVFGCLLVGLAIASRQWAWVYGPFALMALSTGTRGTGRQGAHPVLVRLRLASGIATLAAASVFLPPIARDPSAFRRIFLGFTGESFSEACLGVAGLAERLGLERFLPFLQVFVCLVAFGSCLVTVVRRSKTAPHVLASGWLAWGAVVLLNPFLENYFYLSLGFAAAGYAAGRRGLRV